MTLADPISDMITRIRNAQLRTLYNVKIPNSKFRAGILEILNMIIRNLFFQNLYWTLIITTILVKIVKIVI